MFKKIKENEKYQKFKELRANPQTKAIMSLAIWAIFFLIVILCARGMSSSATDSNDAMVIRVNSYEYTYKTNSKTIFGMLYGDKQLFEDSLVKYYYNGKNVYTINNHEALISDYDFDILKININMLDNLTGNLNSTAGDNYVRYLVPLVNFINLYEVDTEVDLSEASGYNIIVDKYYNGDNLYMIKIDLSNYYKYRNIEDDGILTIDLYNVNKLNDFSTEYERMLG